MFRGMVLWCFLPIIPHIYFSSEWPFAQFHLPEDKTFLDLKKQVIIVGMDGRHVTILSTGYYSSSLPVTHTSG